MNIPIPLPKSPLTDEQYAQMKAWYDNRTSWEDMINRVEKANVMSPEQIKNMRDQLADNVRKVDSVLRAFADLHGY
jgi:hypothetical protein